MRARRDPHWLLGLLIAAALVLIVPSLAGAGRLSWWLWLSLGLNGFALALAAAARGVPAGATRDFLTWLAFGAWLAWAVWWIAFVRIG